jgi:CRP/FNR family transcriptional regulator, cyclic AMP receptor protein
MPTDPNYLRDFSCFRDLSDEQLDAIAQISNAVCYPAGYELFKEGNPGERLFFLLNGKVEVLFEIGEAGQARVDIVSGEEIVGCSVLVEPFVYTATERSLTEVEVLEIDADTLRKMMREDCPLGFAIQQRVINVLMDRIMKFRLES